MTSILLSLLLTMAGWPISCGTELAPPQPEDLEWVWAINEVPDGSFTRYEVDIETGRVLVDRFMTMPLVYPANYGFIPGSMAGDDDPLDVLVITRQPIVPGALIAVRPIGILWMVDGGEQDDKVIAVPVAEIDPHFANVRELEDLPRAELDRIEAFFNTYKLLPEGRKLVELDGVGTSADARRMIEEAIQVCRR